MIYNNPYLINFFEVLYYACYFSLFVICIYSEIDLLEWLALGSFWIVFFYRLLNFIINNHYARTKHRT